MARAEEIRSRLAGLLSELYATPPDPIPTYLHVCEWIGFAKHYSEAASFLASKELGQPSLPRVLVAGHAVECALKAFLLARGASAPHIHDLVDLADRAIDVGARLQEPELVAIVHLNNVFSRDIVSLHKFPVRYPAKTVGASVKTHAPQLLLARIVDSLVEQARSANDTHNRHQWSGIGPDA
ncbi:HEPN domain-containing protein [Azoarcus olearius]|uniref:HEPN domain-containing protein n=1 Tax=Azoarcus sp. (strain BH72) TaxID=418699 RepID=UPI000A042132